MGDKIIGVKFGIWSPEEILKQSVVNVVTDKHYQGNQPVPGGVFDPRFGVIENGKVCPTCRQTNQKCPGHFGHILLARPVYLIQYFDPTHKLANQICLNCSEPRPQDPKVSAKTRECAVCGTPYFKNVSKIQGTAAALQGEAYVAKDEAAIPPVPLETEVILRAFQRLTDEQVELLGYDPKFARPDWMICTVLAVPPLSVRPSVIMDDNQRMEDDLTHQLLMIIRSNNALRDKIDKGEAADTITKSTTLLQYNVATYVDNDIKGLNPAVQRSGRPLRTLKSRLGAKTGRVRGNLMGKRVDFSARSVITPDANIDVDELGVPEEIAKNLTFPERVTVYNRERLMENIRNGPDKHPGAKSVHLSREDKTVSLKYVNAEQIELRDGDVVHRHLIDGDIVLFNRQPSLHKASMEGHRVRVLPYSTFRLNVSATRPYNADFDGDEMNMHVPQSVAAATELRQLTSVLRQIISPRTSSPIIQLFQDTMTGTYRLSQWTKAIPRHVAQNILARITRKMPTGDMTGPELVSGAFPVMNLKAGGATIENGKFVGGILKKSATSATIHAIYNDMGPVAAGKYINDMQAIVTKFNMYSGFSVGTGDLMADSATNEFIDEAIVKARTKIQSIMESVHAGTFQNISSRPDGEELEKQITDAVNTMSNEIAKKIVDVLPKSNRIVQMVDSGSKGGALNISQMSGLLGQQLIEGRRVQYTLQDRTLPHFSKFDDGMESRGFVQNCFVRGLMPAEAFFHAQAGREGLIDTAVKTSDSGYIQRRLMKTMEDLHVEYDGTVRNVQGTVIQIQYGEDGIDPIGVETQAYPVLAMTLEQLYAEFAYTASDIAPFMMETPTETPDLLDEILLDRDMILRCAFHGKSQDIVQAPVHFGRLLGKYTNPYSVKSDLTPVYVVTEIGKLQSEFPRNKLFHALMRYNLAPKKSIVQYRLTKLLFDELMREVRFKYIQALVHPGEMVGAVGAQSIGEPTTQLTLNTFHSAGTTNANATAGVPRMEELMGASKNPKRPGNTLYMLPEIQNSEKESQKKLKEIQKTTLRNITQFIRIYYDPYPTAGKTILPEDQAALDLYQQFSMEKNCVRSPWVVRMQLDPAKLVERNLLDMTQIQTRIENNPVPAVAKLGDVMRMACTMITDAGQMAIRFEFEATGTKTFELSMEFLRQCEEALLDTVVSGNPDIGRVYMRTIKDEPMLSPEVGGYVSKPFFVLDVEGANLMHLMSFPGIDATRCTSNDIHEVNAVFGIEAARLALFEEFNEVFSREKVNYHHLALLVDAMTVSGRIVPVNRFGMAKNETGVLAKSSFEETSKILFNAAIKAEFDDMRGVSANIMFGQKPPCGTGFVDLLVDESRLPEGDEYTAENQSEEVRRVNEKIAALQPAGECRMEDILMDW